MFARTLIAAALVAAAPVAAFAGSHPLSGGGAEAAFKRDVYYADLDLANPAGVAALDRRIARAVEAVCGKADNRDTAAMSRVLACRADAFADAGRQVAELRNKAQYAGRANVSAL